MKKLLSALALVALTILLPVAAAALEPPDLGAEYAYLVETTSGRVLYEKNAHTKAYPASLTKIMTTLLVLEHGGLDETVTVTSAALANLSPDGSTADLKLGEELTVLELVYCIMIQSANEACNVVAEHVAGSVEAFVEMMNDKAAELGCKNTHFTNTHGLHDENHYTTAYDMYLTTMAARKLPQFLEIANTETHEVPATNKTPSARLLKTTNHLISRLTYGDYYYPNAKGIKTGHTTPAGYCLVSLATKDAYASLETMSVVMGAVRTDDGKLGSFIDSKILHEWAFGNFISKTIVPKGAVVVSVPVSLAKDVDEVNLITESGFETVVPKDFDLDTLTLVPHIDDSAGPRNEDGILTAPIDKGVVFGEVDIYLGDVLYGTASLVTDIKVERSEEQYLQQQVGNFFKGAWVRYGLIALGLLLAVYIAVVLIHNMKRRNAKKNKSGAYRGRR